MGADFFLCALLAFGTFVLAAERSSLATCLATFASKPSEPEPCPTIAERKFEERGRGEVFLEGT